MLDTKCPCPVLGYQIETLDDEIVLFHPAKRAIFYSNSIGALIWFMCDGQRTVTEIIQILSATYPDAGQQIAQDVPQTLTTFAEHGAITWL